MYKLLLFLIVALCCHKMAKAQQYAGTQPDIYNAVLHDYREDWEWTLRVSINPKTSLNLFKEFAFLHPNYYSIDTTSMKLSKEWLIFLRSVDKTKISVATIDIKAIHFGNRRIKIKQKKWDRLINLSSQIISDDGNKAVVGFSDYGEALDSSTSVILLEKKDGKWIKVETILISMS